MNLDLHPSYELKQICLICNRSINDHEANCPQGKLKEIGTQIATLLMACPNCHESNSVLPNADDYLECQKCHALFTRSFVAMGHDPDKLEKVLFITYTDTFQAHIIPEKGTGDFPLLKSSKELIKICENFKQELLNAEE